jgi:hypothetical protein
MKLWIFSLTITIENVNGGYIPSPEMEVMTTREMRTKLAYQLADESSYMTDYLRRKMNEEFSFDCRRINLVCTNQKLRDKIYKFDSVHEIDIPFDIKYFSLPTLEEKQAYLYDVLTQGIKILCDRKGWDFSLWEKHLLELRDSGFRVEHDFGGKKCRNGKLTAKLFGVHTMTENNCYVDFYRGRKMLQRSFLRTTSVDIMLCMDQINRMEWVDEKTVAVYNYNDTEIYYATLQEENY